MANELFRRASFYIIAHADDWQLFMQPNAFNDLMDANCKCIFIFTTAGDAGNIDTYWSAREEGVKSSIRFCLAPLKKIIEVCDIKKINSYLIPNWSCNNSTCYFMRLPDGGLDGNGFARYHFQSLSKFNNGEINLINTVDNLSTYTSSEAFYSTLQAIIINESFQLTDVQINYINPDRSKNPADHPDHLATGLALQATTILSGITQLLFLGYSSKNSLKALNAKDYFWKAGTFAAYEKTVFDASGYSTLKEDVDAYIYWCSKAASFITINESKRFS